MIFPPIFELSMVGIFDAGVPNQERLVIRPTERVNLAQFGVVLCVQFSNQPLFVVNDNLFWFSGVEVAPPAWIVLFTCEGAYQIASHPKTGHPVHMFYWERKQTIFTSNP